MSDDFKRFQTHFGSGNLGKQKEQNWSRKMQDPLKEDNKKISASFSLKMKLYSVPSQRG